jgi:phosphopantothenoylcysteine decarboxylase / phosphopantothenate---cysteine ligase
MPNILLGVSGGIAAYKALELIRLATGAGHSVRVVQTPTSQRFVGEASFAALTGAPVLVDEFQDDPARGAFPGQDPPQHRPLSHLQLVQNADLYLIAPASANTIAKLAHGLADNLLTSCALAATCPLMVAPAMNNRMYEHPSTQANLELLRERGVRVVEPDAGRLASIGEEGIGRLAEPRRLLEECERVIAESPPRRESFPHENPAEWERARDVQQSAQGVLSGQAAATHCPWSELSVLVTAGGTREPIDSVRFVGNSSSGRMGTALAERAARRGASVTLIAANVTLPTPAGVEVVRVGSAWELQMACEQLFERCDVLLMAAAVSDFRPTSPIQEKIKKGARERLQIELEPTEDVLSGLAAQRRPNQTLVGFAAEHGPNAIDLGRTKLTAKHLDALVVNDISRFDIGFESEDNEVTILTGAGERHVTKTSKEAVADVILDAVETLRSQP